MFLYSHWMRLPLSTRVKISSQFGIAKTGSTHVVGDRVQDDGYKISDVENALNMEAVQQFTGSKETDPVILFDLLVSQIENPVETVVVIPEEIFEKAKESPSVLVERPKRKYTKRK